MKRIDIDVARIGYYQNDSDQLQQLFIALQKKEYQTAQQLYDYIEAKVLRQIRFVAFPIQVVLQDLRDVRSTSNKQANVLQSLLLQPCATLEQIARQNHITKQATHAIIKKYAQKFQWMQKLRVYRRNMFQRGNKNNQTGKNGVKEKEYEQMQLFDREGN